MGNCFSEQAIWLCRPNDKCDYRDQTGMWYRGLIKSIEYTSEGKIIRVDNESIVLRLSEEDVAAPGTRTNEKYLSKKAQSELQLQPGFICWYRPNFRKFGVSRHSYWQLCRLVSITEEFNSTMFCFKPVFDLDNSSNLKYYTQNKNKTINSCAPLGYEPFLSNPSSGTWRIIFTQDTTKLLPHIQEKIANLKSLVDISWTNFEKQWNIDEEEILASFSSLTSEI